MGPNPFEMETTIIHDEQPLLETFVPDRLYHRDDQTQFIVNALKPVAAGRTPRNVFLHGPTGTGKTSAVLWVFEQLEVHTTNVKTVYVNCWQKTSHHAVVSEIAQNVVKFTNIRKTTQELVQDIKTYLERNNKRLVVCLDEVDRLDDYDILYDLSRNNYGLIAISNDKYAMTDVDDRIRSSLSFEELEFPQYSTDEIADILMDRVSFAFVPGSVDFTTLKIAAQASEGDARVALDIVRKAGLIAESQGKRKVTVEHVIEAKRSTTQLKVKQILTTLNEDMKLLYKLIEETKSIKSVDLWEKYQTSVAQPMSERAYRKYMQKLVSLRLVKAEGDVRWREYRV